MKHGFSLVELSIVLVILGLLTGGILGGQALMHAAELRTVAKDYETHQMALNTFRDKYFALPGDMKNATAFWGAADTSGSGGQCGAPLSDAGTGTQTCNGNGNGEIDPTERYRVWQHLTNANLITGNFTGIAGPAPVSGYEDILDVNVPRSYNNGGINLEYRSQSTIDTYFGFNTTADNYYHIAGCCSTASKITRGPAMTPEDAWQVDTKIDDGRPYYGFMQVQNGYWSSCTTANSVDANYDLSKNGVACSMYLSMD